MGLSRKVIEKKDSKTVFAMGFVASPLNGRPRCIREHEQTARADKWRDESSISTRWNKRGQHDTTNTRGGRKRSTRVSRIIFFLRIRHNSRHWWLVTRRKSMDEIRMWKFLGNSSCRFSWKRFSVASLLYWYCYFINPLNVGFCYFFLWVRLWIYDNIYSWREDYWNRTMCGIFWLSIYVYIGYLLISNVASVISNMSKLRTIVFTSRFALNVI